MQLFELAPIVISTAALAVSLSGHRLSRGQARQADRHRARELTAAIVAELTSVDTIETALRYTLHVVNAGPAVARDVDMSFVEWSDESALGRIVSRSHVAPVMLRGEARTVVMELSRLDARFDDRTVALELGADYYDDAGVRNERLALVFEDSLVHLPPDIPDAA